jgi:hypothetical protein
VVLLAVVVALVLLVLILAVAVVVAVDGVLVAALGLRNLAQHLGT